MAKSAQKILDEGISPKTSIMSSAPRERQSVIERANTNSVSAEHDAIATPQPKV
jgi:hypothetical protein